MSLPSAGGRQRHSAVCWARAAKATRNRCVGSWMGFPSSLVTPASCSAQVQRYRLSSRAVAVAPAPAGSSDSSSFLLSCVHGHSFSEACSCLYKQKVERQIQRYGTCYFSKNYCPGARTNSGSFNGELRTLPVKKEIKQLSSVDC